MSDHTYAWCGRWTSYCNGRGKCGLGTACPVVSIDPCAPSLEATGWTDEGDGLDCPKFWPRSGGGFHG